MVAHLFCGVKYGFFPFRVAAVHDRNGMDLVPLAIPVGIGAIKNEIPGWVA